MLAGGYNAYIETSVIPARDLDIEILSERLYIA